MGIQHKLAAFLKQRRIRQYLDFHRSPSDVGGPESEMRHAIHYPSLELSNRQRDIALSDDNIFVEEHGTFLELTRRFEENLELTVETARWILFPFNLGCLYSNKWTADDQYLFLEEIEVLRRMACGRPIVFFSTFDFSFVRNRTTYPEVVVQDASVLQKFEWVLDSDKFIQFECTRDHQSQIPAFPLVSLRPVAPGSMERPFLFSFVGRCTKKNWPEGFIRSPSQAGKWQRVLKGHEQHAFIGSEAQAKGLGFSNPYTAIPAKSVFTLCPRGFAAWTFRLYESLLAGSIPVILSDSYIPPFGETIDWDSFCLRLTERDLPEVGEILSQIDSRTIVDMQERLALAQRHFVAEGLWQQIRSYLNAQWRLQEKTLILPSPALADLGMPVPDKHQRSTRRLVNTVATYQILLSEDESLFELHMGNFLAEDRDGPPSNESLLLAAVDSHLQTLGELPVVAAPQFRETRMVLKSAAQTLDKGAFAHGALIGALQRGTFRSNGHSWASKEWLISDKEANADYALCESLFKPALMKEILAQLKLARWDVKSHEGIGLEKVACATPTLLLLNVLLNSTHFIREVESAFSLKPNSIRYGSGRIYRLRPGCLDYDSWHDDIVRGEGRCVAFAVGLSDAGFAGGDLVLREKKTQQESARISLALPGRAVLFRVSPDLEHRVEPVAGERPRDVFAGWFRTNPLE